MSALQEIEIFSCLSENFSLAAERCEQLAWHPRRGFVYNDMRNSLRLVEGACRQAALYRDDTRWLQYGMAMGWAHKKAGAWMRSSATKDARKVVHPLFAKLADTLRMLAHEAERLKTAATGRMGIILPDELPGPHRDTRPVQVMRPSGLIVPAIIH